MNKLGWKLSTEEPRISKPLSFKVMCSVSLLLKQPHPNSRRHIYIHWMLLLIAGLLTTFLASLDEATHKKRTFFFRCFTRLITHFEIKSACPAWEGKLRPLACHGPATGPWMVRSTVLAYNASRRLAAFHKNFGLMLQCCGYFRLVDTNCRVLEENTSVGR